MIFSGFIEKELTLIVITLIAFIFDFVLVHQVEFGTRWWRCTYMRCNCLNGRRFISQQHLQPPQLGPYQGIALHFPVGMSVEFHENLSSTRPIYHGIALHFLVGMSGEFFLYKLGLYQGIALNFPIGMSVEFHENLSSTRPIYHGIALH